MMCQRVSLKISNLTLSYAYISILKPDGTALASNQYVANGSLIEPLTLPTDGTYTVVFDPQNASTGSATLTLYDVPSDTSDSISVGGSAVAATTKAPGQNSRVSFDTTSGQNLTLNLSNVTMGTSSCCGATVSVLNPDGSTLVSPIYIGTSGGSVSVKPISTGTHTIVINPQGSATGSMTLALSTSNTTAATTAKPARVTNNSVYSTNTHSNARAQQVRAYERHQAQLAHEAKRYRQRQEQREVRARKLRVERNQQVRPLPLPKRKVAQNATFFPAPNAERPAGQASGLESWIPQGWNRHGSWKINLLDTPWSKLPREKDSSELPRSPDRCCS